MRTCLVNLAYLDPARIGGVGRIAHEVGQLLAECADTSGDMRVIFVVGWRFAGTFVEWLGQPAVVVPFITRHDLRLTLRLLKPDVIVSPLFGLEPFTQAKAIHIAGMPDALALDHPELFSAADLAYRKQVYANLKQAARVVTLSEHARERLLHHTELQLEQVVVVPLGAEPQEQSSAISRKSQVNTKTIKPPRHREHGDFEDGLPARYVFYPANFWPHKRHDLLFRIMKRLWEGAPDLHLVMTGGRSEADKQGLQTLINKYGCPPERIHDLGYVDDIQLRQLYHEAEALLFVSQYEGFGMPLLEAMQQDCPVICAPLASIPEVVGEAAIYVNSEDVEDWAKAVFVQLPQERDQLIEAGRKQAAQFTWAKTRSGWQTVLSAFGVGCDGQSGQTNTQSAEVAGRIQPLLARISQQASAIGRSRVRQLIGLPIVILLQMRGLWLAQGYRSSK
jgi:glycosyltransferase involved in cell wall biosynthesis